MERYKESADRNQMNLLPMSFDDMIDVENPVRAIDAIVENMDIPNLGFKYAKTAATGRKPYSPVDMFKLYTYSYFNGIRSSRKIERECGRNIEVMWLIGGLAPDFKTIADFRKDNKAAIKKAFSRFSMLCDGLGLIGKEMVAVDGSKFRANNSSDKYCTARKTKKKIEHYEDQAKKYLSLLDANDEQERQNPPPIFTKKDLQKKLSGIEKRIGELQDQLSDIEQNGDIALTDPDSKMMLVKNNGREVSHNIQVAVESSNHLIVAVDVTSEAIDREQLHNISAQAKEELNVPKLTVIADKGYYSAKQFMLCETDNIFAIAPKPTLQSAPNERYAKDKFIYDENSDAYICPEGTVLAHVKKRATSKSEEENYTNPSTCKKCAVREQCTKSPYRTIQDPKYQRFADRVDIRTALNKELFRQRKCLAEHPFGTVKRAFGFTYFLTRGTESVRAESCLHFLTYNMKRAIRILGTGKIVAEMQA